MTLSYCWGHLIVQLLVAQKALWAVQPLVTLQPILLAVALGAVQSLVTLQAIWPVPAIQLVVVILDILQNGRWVDLYSTLFVGQPTHLTLLTKHEFT